MNSSTTLLIDEKRIIIHGRAGEYIFEQIRKSGTFYEEDVLLAIASLGIVDSGLFVDVGANLGNHTLFFAAFLEKRVISFEPVHANFEYLEQNITENGLESLVEAVELGVGRALGEGYPRLAIEGNWGTFHLEPSPGEAGVAAVKIVSLDDHMGSQTVALLKIDVEGHEMEVLEGASRIIQRDRPVIVIEAKMPSDRARLLPYLERLGYIAVQIAAKSDTFIFIYGDRAPGYQARFGVEDRRMIGRKIDGLYGRVGRANESLQRTEGHVAEIEKAMSRNDPGRMDSGLNARLDALAVELEKLAHSEAERRSSLQTLGRLAQAFTVLSAHVGSDSKNPWDSAIANGLVTDAFPQFTPFTLPGDSTEEHVREITRSSRRSCEVRVGIASIPTRTASLANVLKGLAPQVDEIVVYLNECDTLPRELPNFRNVRFLTGPDLGDRGKFIGLPGFHGYFLTCDDDIQYPSFYVQHIISGIEKYNRKAAVGWHGSIFAEDFQDYYDSKFRRVLAFYSDRPQDTPVHLLGTGIMGFHTDGLDLDLTRFTLPNMADAWVAIQAQEQQVPMVVLHHRKGWAIPIDTGDESISLRSIHKSDTSRLNVRQTVSELVRERTWKVLSPPEPRISSGFSVGIIGRTDRERWKKGGILESCHRINESLLGYNVDSRLFDIETGDPEYLEGFDPTCVMVYVGDPERPDYARVERLIEKHARLGRAMILNMSITGREARNQYIAEKIRRWDEMFPGQVSLMTFTEAARSYPPFKDLQHLILEIPKTISYDAEGMATFEGSDGVFIGDIAKLSDRGIIDGDGHEWIAGIRAALPGVKIYAVQQYKPRFAANFDIDVVWPFLREDFGAKLAKMRLMVAPAKFLTFEMVPMEVMGLGVPVVYRAMPQSLSETIGLAGLQVDHPERLRDVLPTLYNDPRVWQDFSEAGKMRSASQATRVIGGHIYLRFQQAARRASLANG